MMTAATAVANTAAAITPQQYPGRRHEIINMALILQAISARPLNKWNIMHETEIMNLNSFNKYFDTLYSKGFIEETVRKRHEFRTTDAGKQALAKIIEVLEMLH